MINVNTGTCRNNLATQTAAIICCQQLEHNFRIAIIRLVVEHISILMKSLIKIINLFLAPLFGTLYVRITSIKRAIDFYTFLSI